jgi:cyanuric acid amidohydrolase
LATIVAQRVEVFRLATAGPGDVSGLAALLDSGDVRAEEVVAILGKTEGNGGVNDFTRGYATFACEALLAARLGVSRTEVGRRVALVMSGGTEAVMSPHLTVFARREVGPASAGSSESSPTESDASPAGIMPTGEKRLAVGVAATRDFLPEEIGRAAMIDETAAGVREAMRDAGIDDPRDVHFVQIKCPLLTSERMDDARRRSQTLVTEDTYKSMGYSRGASALGVAVALGEVERGKVDDDAVCHDWSLFSSVASTSAGVELMNNENIVMGNAPGAASDLVIGHAVMRDAIDGAGVRAALHSAGIEAGAAVTTADALRIVNVLAKAEADPTGFVRGRRHTMLNDSDITSTRHARAAVAAVIASIVGDPMVYVSGGAEHQGPPGGGPVAAIVRT